MPRALPRMFGERAEIQKPHVRICAGARGNLRPYRESNQFAAPHESAIGRFCCKSRKIPGDDFFERNEAELCSPINMAPRPLRKSPVRLSPGDEVPHVFIRESHQRPRKILISGGKQSVSAVSPRLRLLSSGTAHQQQRDDG